MVFPMGSFVLNVSDICGPLNVGMSNIQYLKTKCGKKKKSKYVSPIFLVKCFKTDSNEHLNLPVTEQALIILESEHGEI